MMDTQIVVMVKFLPSRRWELLGEYKMAFAGICTRFKLATMEVERHE